MRYEKKNKTLYIEKGISIEELLKLNLHNKDVSEYFRKRTNALIEKQKNYN